jgi:hypothetical protein
MNLFDFTANFGIEESCGLPLKKIEIKSNGTANVEAQTIFG